MSARDRGTCSACAQERSLRSDGTVRRHYKGTSRDICPGSRQAPKEDGR